MLRVNTQVAPRTEGSRSRAKAQELRKTDCLVYDQSLSHGPKGSGNYLIQGDNLKVLELLSPEIKGKVRCVYIDPPYNNQEKYFHYDDDLCHHKWLKALEARLILLRDTLREDGSLWVSIDDSEMHYLKVALDRIFGRQNFVTTVVWQQRTTRENRNTFSNDHEYILVYAKNYKEFKKTRNLLPMGDDIKSRYQNPDNDPRGPWQSVSANVQAGHAVASQFYEIIGPNGVRHAPPKGRCWAYNQATMQKAISENNVWFGKNGTGVPRLKKFLSESRNGVTPKTLWTAGEVGTTDSAKKHLLGLLPEHSLFDTPKPEALLHRILQIATDPGDIVLDAFLGSGTTASAAHQMKRRYVGIEVGDHAATHCSERLKQIAEGHGSSILDRVKWQGGGGFDFFHYES